MADQATSLPVRTEADGTDERLHAKLVDGVTPSQIATVDTDLNLKVAPYGDRCDTAADIALLLSEQGRPNGRGDYEADDNSCPATAGLIAHNRSATHDDTQLALRPTAVSGASDSISLDVSLHDEAGAVYSESNPLPVSLEASSGAEVCDYDTAAAIAKDATDNHDYTVTALKTLTHLKIWSSASGKLKVEVQLETAAASGVFNAIMVGFNSTANPNIDMSYGLDRCEQVAGAIVRIIRTNLDNQAQDLYSTITGVEI